jgi:hypothetical protein
MSHPSASKLVGFLESHQHGAALMKGVSDVPKFMTVSNEDTLLIRLIELAVPIGTEDDIQSKRSYLKAEIKKSPNSVKINQATTSTSRHVYFMVNVLVRNLLLS